MKLTVELDHESDGRWLAEIPELNIHLHAESKLAAIERAESAAEQILHEKVARGELTPESARPLFDLGMTA